MNTGTATNAGTTARVVVGAVVGVLLLLGALAVAVVRVGGGTHPAPSGGRALEPAPTTAGQPLARPLDRGASRSAERTVVDGAWVVRTASSAGIPPPALRAYADAELVLRAEQPGCRLSWNTLAGIGWIESRHGTVGGRTLLADGRPSRPILGPGLNGMGGVAAIHATGASVARHGDRLWEHAVGPLQFLTSTWQRWGADGDGDGAADPGDLDDASLAAARYLCADGHDLATDDGWNAAVHSYNHDAAYVAAVAAAANAYVERTR